MNLRFSRSSTKHRVSKDRARFVIEHCGLRFEVQAPANPATGADNRLVFLGDDEMGIALEVMGIEMQNGDLLVIHAMELRARYRPKYEEAKKWRR